MALNSPTSNFPKGVTNAAPWQALAQSAIPDPSYTQLYHNDFNTFVATDFTATVTGTGTTALSPESGGVLLATTTAGAADANYYQLPVAGFVITTGSNLFFKARIKLDSATLGTVYAGLISTSATPLTAPDGVFFLGSSGGSTWILRCRVGGVNTDTPLPASLITVVNAWLELSYYYDGQGNIVAYFNPSTGNVPRPVTATGGTNSWVARIPVGTTLTGAVLAPSFGYLNSSAAARTMRVDYITVSNEL